MSNSTYCVSAPGASGDASDQVRSCLRVVLVTWAHCQNRIIVLAAEPADGVELVRDGAPTAAHWIADVADIETSTARLITVLTVLLMRSTLGCDRSTVAQQHADNLELILQDRVGAIGTEIVLHVRGDGCTLDDGSPTSSNFAARPATTTATH